MAKVAAMTTIVHIAASRGMLLTHAIRKRKMMSGEAHHLYQLIASALKEQILKCHPNYDLDNMHTIVRDDVFTRLLTEANYDPKEIEFISNGFSKGCYRGPQQRQQRASNMPFRCGSKIQLWNKMIKEVNLKRFAGPFTSIPCDYFIQSAVSLVLKKSDDPSSQTCLVFNLLSCSEEFQGISFFL